jgi:polyphenol oxidase
MLPQLDECFAWVRAGGAHALVCRALEPYAPHFFTTRAWRLGSPTGNQADDGWAEVAEASGVRPNELLRLHQVHGATVVVAPADRSAAQLPDADIIVANDPAVALAIQTADCVPLLIADPRSGAVAAAHAGWRGIAARAPQAAGAALQREFDSAPADLIAAIGPSVGACCYEVGRDVRDAFAAASFGADRLSRWFVDAPRPTVRNPSMRGLPAVRRPDHWFFDGAAAVRDQLESCGLRPDRVHASDVCTASHVELCSYRRDGTGAGRIAAVIRPR